VLFLIHSMQAEIKFAVFVVSLLHLPETQSSRYTGKCRRSGAHSTTAISQNISMVPFTAAPCITGLWKPVILIPKSMLEKLSDDELTFIILHEI